MTETGRAETGSAKAVLADVREHGDRASLLTHSIAPIMLAAAEELYAGYRAAIEAPEEFAQGSPPRGPSSRSRFRSETQDPVERSVRAEFAVALGLSEPMTSRLLEQGRLLVEDLPATRAALAEARIHWRSGELICATAASLPVAARAELDERAAGAAPETTPTQLRHSLARWREELHEEPLTERHARAREERTVWITPEVDGMATLHAHLPAPAALGAYARLDRTARILRDGSDDPDRVDGTRDTRTLAQLRADALTDLLLDGEVTGTTPLDSAERAAPTFAPSVRAEIRLTLPATTATGLGDASAHLDGYGLIPADTARELVGVGASFTRVLTDPVTGVVASVGRTHRVPTPQMRLHLQLRDQTCRFPGCTRSASGAEADHTTEWRNGGETALHNLCCLCVAHHHVRHGDRWSYTLHPDGTAEWTTPTGRRITTRPPALPGGPPPRPRIADPPPPL